MNPETHLFASWVIGAKTTDNARDCRLVALAGILPDLDGLGIIGDGIAGAMGHRTFFYGHYHHYLSLVSPARRSAWVFFCWCV